MSIPSDSPLRGCAANFPQPVQEDDLLEAQNLVNNVSSFNSHHIVYRSSDRDHDVLHHVFRWIMTPYDQVFTDGFQARPQGETPVETYFDLNLYVHHGGRPLNSTSPTTHAFVSTTLNSGWFPFPSVDTLRPGGQIQAYRYEIFAPGGIWVARTLGNLYQYPRQNEVCFVAGIAPQYIRSAQLFTATREVGSMFVSWSRADNRIRVNGRFNPQSDPSRLLTIQRPIFDYRDEDRRSRYLTICIYRPQLPPLELAGEREKRQVSDDTTDWYAGDVANVPGYINAAFRSSRTNEAYLFMKNEYVLLDYAPGTTDDKIVNGPLLICDGYPSLIGTAFGEHGIDCAFDNNESFFLGIFHRHKAFIFSGNLCAYIDYAPGTTDDEILEGPMTITAMFPFFKDTVFENSVDAAFRSSRENEAYLFKGNQYALINYDSKNLIAIRNITQGFYSLKGTIFESGIDAAFASHRTGEAYLFKGDQYALINFAPGTTDDYIIGGVKPVLPNWPSLQSILPRKNRGLDTHDHHNQPQADRHRVHDEL